MNPDSPRILLLLLGLIGDTMMRIPAVRALREAMPEAEFTGLCHPLTAPILKVNPLFDRVATLDSKAASWRDQARLYLELRRRRFDIVLDFYYGARTPFLAWFTGARRRIGPAPSWQARRLLTDPLPFPLAPVHMIDRHLAIVQPLGVAALRRRWEFPLPAGAAAATREALAAAGIATPPGEGDLVVTAGAGDVSKRWEEEFYEDFLARAASGELGGGRRVLLAADQREPVLVERWRGIAGVQVLPPLTLPQLGALFAAADLVFVPDTGPMHLALANARRLLTFFQSTDPVLHRAERPAYRYLYREVCPYQPCDTKDKHRCELECRRSLPVDEVMAAARELLVGPAWDGTWG